MPKIDELKARLGFAEKMFLTGLAIIFSLVGWTASNYNSVSPYQVGAALVLIILAAIFSMLQYKRIKVLTVEIGRC